MATRQARQKPRREAMSTVDTAWLRMDRASNQMMITGVLMFAEPMALDAVRRVIGQRFLAYARFRQKVVEGGNGTWWQDDAEFDLDWHVQAASLPSRGSHKRALERLVGRLASAPLDRQRPLWQFHLVEDYRGGSALIARIHHCYADGIALVQVLLSLTDTTRDGGGGRGHRPSAMAQDGAGSVLPAGVVERCTRIGGALLGKGMEMVQEPALAAMLAKEGGEIAMEWLRAVALPDDPPSLLRGGLGVDKRVAWAEPVALDDVKAVGRACGCTVNDVLMAVAAGALRDYLQGRGEAVEGMTLRATVPVNLRPPGPVGQLGNQFGMVFLELPVGEANPVRRVERVVQCMRNLKGSRQAMAMYALLAALGVSPQPLHALALDLLSRKASVVATNVPGPQQPLYMAGRRLDGMMFWVPQSGSIGLGLSILSYGNHVHFGLMADAGLIPDPDAVARRFLPQFETLLYLALMGDWQRAFGSTDAEAVLSTGNAM
jgi:diacylglycerol O-acyltransferase / wax synthase